jgi:hypothetical protein
MSPSGGFHGVTLVVGRYISRVLQPGILLAVWRLYAPPYAEWRSARRARWMREQAGPARIIVMRNETGQVWPIGRRPPPLAGSTVTARVCQPHCT